MSTTARTTKLPNALHAHPTYKEALVATAVVSSLAMTLARAINASLELTTTLPPEVWREAVDDTDRDERALLADKLDRLLENAARLRGYLDGRDPLKSSGDVNYDHRKGVRMSSALAALVRRQLGYMHTPPVEF